MNWQEVCKHPNLQNLPFKIELDQYGRILMSPVKVIHAALQGEIESILHTVMQQEQGRAFPECAIKTSKGTRVADVVWVSDQRFQTIKYQTECSIAPEICIEVISPSNTTDEIEEKVQLYFAAGAEEVWVCQGNGEMLFYLAPEFAGTSKLAPEFPKQIEI